MKLEAIVPSAGKGVRLKNTTAKPFVKIQGKPIIIHTLSALLKSSLINNIILVIEADKIDQTQALIKKFNLKRIKAVVAGGPRRQDSVRRGLGLVDKTADFVLIHDGVRPFLPKEIISSVVKTAYKFGAAIVGVPVKATLKLIQSNAQPIIKKTLNRKQIWEIQTPQVFKREIILKAYKRFKNQEATDDSFLVEKLGVDVYVVRGSYFNIKITTPEDLVLAEAISKNII